MVIAGSVWNNQWHLKYVKGSFTSGCRSQLKVVEVTVATGSSELGRK